MTKKPSITFDELEPISKQLDSVTKKHGLEYQLIVGFKNFSFYTSYHGDEKIIKQLDSSILGRTFLVHRRFDHHRNNE